MSIEGLRTAPQPIDANISDQIGASVEALNILGLVENRDQVTESVTDEFRSLGHSGRTGELYIQLPRSVITLDSLVKASDSATYPSAKQYPESYVYRELWTPSYGSEGYKAEELDNLTLGSNGDFAPHARLAVHNPASEQEPLLHFLDKPFYAKYAKRKQQTQIEAVDQAVAAYEAEGHEDFEMAPLNAKAVAFIALTRRIKGETMPMAWGYMRDATLPRKEVGGRSFVGDVCSCGGRLELGGSDGGPDSGSGVGLSVGQKELKV